MGRTRNRRWRWPRTLTTLGLTCASNMVAPRSEVQAELCGPSRLPKRQVQTRVSAAPRKCAAQAGVVHTSTERDRTTTGTDDLRIPPRSEPEAACEPGCQKPHSQLEPQIPGERSKNEFGVCLGEQLGALANDLGLSCASQDAHREA